MRRLRLIVALVTVLLAFHTLPPARADAPDVRSTVDALRQATVAGDLDAVLALYVPTAVVASPFGTFAGSDQIRGFYRQFLSSNPGLDVAFVDRTDVLDSEVHRSIVSSDGIAAAGVHRILFMETIVVIEQRVVSVTITFDLADAQTARFAAAQRGS